MSEEIKKFFSKIRERLTPKRIIIAIAIALSIFLPTILAIVSIPYFDKQGDKNAERIQTVILSDSNGTQLYREDADARENGDTSLVSIFNTINDNLVQSDKIPDNVVTEAPLTAELRAVAAALISD